MDTKENSIYEAVGLARGLSPEVIQALQSLIKTGSDDIKIKAAGALIRIMSIDRQRLA